MEAQYYNSEREMRIAQLKQYGKLSPARKAKHEADLARWEATPEKYQDKAKMSTLRILLEVRG